MRPVLGCRTKGFRTKEERVIKKRLNLPKKIIQNKTMTQIYLSQVEKASLLFL